MLRETLDAKLVMEVSIPPEMCFTSELLPAETPARRIFNDGVFSLLEQFAIA